MRLKLISCEIFYREMCAAVARSPHLVDLEFLPKGLHDIGSAKMSARLQEAVDAVDAERYEAVLLGYALCGTGLVGLTARAIPLVLPRAHDCITLLLGSRERYAEFAVEHPGTYFLSSGWIERSGTEDSERQLTPLLTTGPSVVFDDLVAKYGEDNAKFLWNELYGPSKYYTSIAFIPMGVEPTEHFRRIAMERAESRGISFQELKGDMTLLERLVNGPWDDDFQVFRPGETIRPTYDEAIIGAGMPEK